MWPTKRADVCAMIPHHQGAINMARAELKHGDSQWARDMAQKVIDAVKAKDSSATIDTVRKDPDGSYDALGTTSDGAKVMFEVSADLATITQGQGGQGGQGGPRGQATGGSTTGGSGAAANGTAGTATPTLPSN